jgi:hypothetical protein
LRIAFLGLLAAVSLCTAVAAAQDPTIAFPNNYRNVLENADVTVLRAHYAPHESVGVHEHSDHPTVYVYLNDSGPVRFVHEPENVVLTRPPTHAGAYRVSPGRRERHSLVNLSDKPSDYIRVELKKLPLGTLKREFRQAAPAEPLKQGTTVEFEDPALRIERVICNPGAACELNADAAPSVLIAFSPVELATRRRWSEIDPASAVAWMPPNRNEKMRSPDDAPAHLLRIVLLAH